MATITVSSNPSTTGDTLTVNFTTDATDISDILISKDGGNSYQSATSFTTSSAVFDVTNWSNGTYSNCKLKCVYVEAGGGSGGSETPLPELTISKISDITEQEHTEFYIYYSTNRAVAKHEFSWDGGNMFYDKTNEIVTSNETNYKYLHDNHAGAQTYHMAIRLTDANGNSKKSNVFNVNLTPAPITINQINNMTVTKGQPFSVTYNTSIEAVKHEISWDEGKNYYDKTAEITSNGTTYTYKHDADSEHDTLPITIKVTDVNELLYIVLLVDDLLTEEVNELLYISLIFNHLPILH